MAGHLLTVDLSNKTAFLTTPSGATMAAWSDVTRRGALEHAAACGWAPASDWILTSPPDGFYCHVVEDRGA